MPIVIRPRANDSSNDLVKRFKKAVGQSDIVQLTKDRAVFVGKGEKRAIKRIEAKRLRRRARSLKRMKNVSEAVIQRINDRLNA